MRPSGVDCHRRDGSDSGRRQVYFVDSFRGGSADSTPADFVDSFPGDFVDYRPRVVDRYSGPDSHGYFVPGFPDCSETETRCLFD
jgi:hypothetical protein